MEQSISYLKVGEYPAIGKDNFDAVLNLIRGQNQVNIATKKQRLVRNDE